MRQGDLEIEVKIAVDDAIAARESLLKNGAVSKTPRTFEDSVLFDTKARDLAVKDKLLRLRLAGEEVWLTCKEPPADVLEETASMKVLVERECRLFERSQFGEMKELLRGLGYEPTYRYQKYREVFLFDGLTATLDETPIGAFVELEGSPDKIREVASRLGHSEESFMRESYRELHEKHCRRRGLPFGDLVFEDASPLRNGES